ncbi:O-antigen ligase family protein [Pseudoroseomonas cervicalis]|uniref:O-antigen ligase family protein n=1 Tax=Teichococcus cervicalis TaxID=204525 RepID=UPI0022F1B433|nr:O-antigen ligase family protein [Pseudoroseomonas cervicalis]WBV41734.1 O-antigen ligase family protein [Pseudoroseomonas cervicalis]
MSGEASARPAWWAPAAPLLLAALLGPLAAVLQSKAMAPLGLVTLAACIALARWRQGRWPVPRGAALAAGLALAAWAGLSTLWAPEPARSAKEAASLAVILLLAAAAGTALRREPEAERRRLAQALLAGLGLGLAAALFDHASGSALRAAVRGLKEIPPQLTFGLKPAVSVMALLLPLLASGPWPRARRALLLLAGGVLLLLLPGDTAKLAALAGLAVALLALAWPRGGRGLGLALGAGMAAVLLAAPLALGPALQRVGPVVERLPPSAIHRLVIWQFGLERAAEKPLLGWGMESARALPGADDAPDPARLAALGVRSPALLDWFAAPHLTVMPLHPHNGPLQIRLELGWIGTALAALALALLGAAAGRLALPAGALGALASGFVTFLASFGAWQPWWLCSLGLALAFGMALAGGATFRSDAAPGGNPRLP